MSLLNIVGSAPNYRQCPTDGETWCLSTVYEGLRMTHKVARVFELHNENQIDEFVLEPLGADAVIMRPSVKLPEASLLPHVALLARFGKVFSSSIAWMLGMAILERHAVIRIYGVDMKTDSEYADQRDHFFYLMGRAEQLGIAVAMPEDSGVFLKQATYCL